MTPRSTSGQSSQNTFVGRNRELGELRAALDELSAGHGRLFLLSGEPGIGKTRLAEEISNDAIARGMRVLWGRSWEGGGAPSYWPVIQILRSCVDDPHSEHLQSLLGSNAAEIARLVPELKISLPPVDRTQVTKDSESARFLLFDSVATLLKNLARTGPLVIVVDDLHDADQPSLEMLRFIARATKDVPLLIMGTYRDAEVKNSPELGKLVGGLLREGRTLPLTGLSKAEVGDLIASMTGRVADERLVADLYHATDGNALYVEGVVRLLESEEKTPRAANDRGFKIPDGVRESIRRQLTGLSDDTNSLLSIASVIGTEFDTGLLERVPGNSAELIVDRMEEAARTGILTSTLPGYAQCRFSHALIREVLYEGLAAKQRIKLHGEIATAIEELHKSDLKPHWAELARHYTEAGVGQKAIDYWIKAGEAAYSIFGFEKAGSCWRSALAITEKQVTDPLISARLQERLGDPTAARGSDPSEAVAHLEAALRTYQGLGDEHSAARVHTRLGFWKSTNLAAMDIPGALVHFRKAETLLDQNPERASLGFLYAGFGAAAREAMQTKEGLRTSRRAMEIAKKLGSEALWIEAAALHSDLLLNAGQIEEALALIDDVHRKADALDEAAQASTAAVVGSANYVQLWDPSQAETWALRELGKARLTQAPHLRAGLLVRLEAARLQKSELKPEEALQINGRRDTFAEAKWRIFTGEWEIASSAITKSLKYSRRIGSRDATARLMTYVGRICRLEGQLEQGIARLREGLLLCGNDLNSLCEMEIRPELGLLLVETESIEEAKLHLARCHEIMAAGENWRGLAGGVARTDAVVATAERKYEDAETQFGEAVQIFRGYHLPLEEAEALYYWAQALNKSGEHGRANDKLDEAIAIYRRCGAGERWIERIEAVRAPTSATPLLRSESTEQPAPGQNEDVFHREGDIRTTTYEGQTLHPRDLRGLSYSGESRRIVATLLFIDIVSSTEHVTKLRDRRWVELRRSFFEEIRKQLAYFNGREIDATGDGMLAIFDHPAAAINCAFAMSQGVEKLGLQMRAGIHTGECELVGGNAIGIAVHIGARVASQAAATEVLVSSTVRDLLAGGDIRFVDRGTHVLKGVDGEWHLYAAQQPE